MYCVLVQTRNIGFEISSEAVLSGDIVFANVMCETDVTT